MNNLDQKTNEFLDAIRQTNEFKNYQKAKEKFLSDKDAQKLLAEYQEAEQTLVILEQGGFSGADSQKEKTGKLLNEVRKNKTVSEWIKSQNRLQVLISDLATVLSNNVGLKFIPTQRRGCCG